MWVCGTVAIDTFSQKSGCRLPTWFQNRSWDNRNSSRKFQLSRVYHSQTMSQHLPQYKSTIIREDIDSRYLEAKRCYVHFKKFKCCEKAVSFMHFVTTLIHLNLETFNYLIIVFIKISSITTSIIFFSDLS